MTLRTNRSGLPVALRLALILLLWAAFALRLHELTRQNIWWDEARNLEVALRPLLQIATAPELDIQPPFYFWLLHSWGRLTGMHSGAEPGQLAFLARFVSVAVGLIATALLYPLGRFHSRLSGVWAVLLAAFSPFWLAESQEMRMYTLGFALLTAAAVALLSALKTTALTTRRAALISFVLLSALALYTHYNAFFILVAWYLWWGGWALLSADRWPRLRTIFLCGVATILLFLPLVPIALRQIPTYANPNLTIPTLAEYLSKNWQAYLGGYAFDGSLLGGNGVRWLWLVLALALIGTGVWLWQSGVASAASPQKFTRSYVLFLLIWLLGGLGLYYIAVLDRGAFNVRYSSFTTPALYALLGGALAMWGSRWRWLGIIAVMLTLSGLAPALRADLYDARFAREDIAGVTTWLRTVAQPDDLILVDQKYPFGFYYTRYSKDAAIEPNGPETAPARYLFVDINTLDQQLNAWASGARQVFWVQWFESDTDPRHAVPFLLDQAGQRAGSQSFQGYSIDWWTLNPPNHFALAPTLTPRRLAFPPAVETVAVSLPSAPIQAGQPVPVVIRWRRTTGDIDRPLKARVALYDAADARLAQSDERLLNDRHLAPAEWTQQDEPLNVYLLVAPPELAAGEYTLRLLVYDAETLEPLTLVDEAGNPAGQEGNLGTVEIVTTE